MGNLLRSRAPALTLVAALGVLAPRGTSSAGAPAPQRYTIDNCVNTLAPGLIMSDSVVESGTHSGSLVNAVVQSRALKRDAFPDDLLGALVFLASPDSDFVTGQVIAVDGGAVNN